MLDVNPVTALHRWKETLSNILESELDAELFGV